MSEESNIDDNDLKQIRKEKGLSLSEVSDQLKLTKDVIVKLENSQFKELGAYTYVRGYLNHYSRLLGVDAQKYIELIPKSEIEVELINTSSHISKGIKLKRQSTHMANYLIGTFVVAAISFSGWFLLKNYSGISNKLNKPQESIEISQPIADNNNNNELQIMDDKPEDQKEKSYHYSSLIPSEEQNQTTLTNKIKDENQLLIPEKPHLTEALSSKENTNNIDAKSYEIKVVAEETSWLKIEKLDGEKLHNDLMKPGELTIQSNEPVHFRIGNGQHIKVFINGEELNLSSYTRKNITDFKWPLDS